MRDIFSSVYFLFVPPRLVHSVISLEKLLNDEKMKVIIFLVLLGYVHSFAQEKLQVLTTKKVENCEHRAQVGDTLYMQYLVRYFL